MIISMPRLHITDYSRELAGKTVFIACREGILRDHFKEIVADIKFLNRHGIVTTFFHNMSHRFANRKHFRELAKRLADTRIVRVPPEVDFYTHVLEYPDHVFKLIFLERKYLIDQKGRKINSLTTQSARDSMSAFGDLIANVNFKIIMEQVCRKIDDGKIERVHILPAGKHTIKHELFTIEGTGTLIANNFTEEFAPVVSDEELEIVFGILDRYKREGFLKPRSKKYIQEHRNNFYITRIDGIIVGCAEKKEIDPQTVELGALAISTRFRNQRVGVFIVNAFIAEMIQKGYRRFISLTNNPRLQTLYYKLGFVQQSPPEYHARQEQSPRVKMFFKELT